MSASQVEQPDQGRIVASLAAECHLPVDEMAALYEHERAELAVGAHLTKFLHIFATRNVLEVLRQRSVEQHPSGPAPRQLTRATISCR
jgi:hypothetical protein